MSSQIWQSWSLLFGFADVDGPRRSSMTFMLRMTTPCKCHTLTRKDSFRFCWKQKHQAEVDKATCLSADVFVRVLGRLRQAAQDSPAAHAEPPRSATRYHDARPRALDAWLLQQTPKGKVPGMTPRMFEGNPVSCFSASMGPGVLQNMETALVASPAGRCQISSGFVTPT